jgi:hypothetical protein
MPRYAHLVQRLREAVLDGSGTTSPELRRAAAARSAELGGGPAAAEGEIPTDLRGYVDTIARHAYRVTDEDIDALRRAGWSEDAIFEISISAAVGAGFARLERGLAALKESRP